MSREPAKLIQTNTYFTDTNPYSENKTGASSISLHPRPGYAVTSESIAAVNNIALHKGRDSYFPDIS